VSDPQTARIRPEDDESRELDETPNPVILKLLVAPYRAYQILPSSLRRQLNLALDKLREKRRGPKAT
jgi:hypothetical protein